MSFDFLHIIDNLFILTDHPHNFALEKAATHSNLIGVLGVGVAFNVIPVQPKGCCNGYGERKSLRCAPRNQTFYSNRGHHKPLKCEHHL